MEQTLEFCQHLKQSFVKPNNECYDYNKTNKMQRNTNMVNASHFNTFILFTLYFTPTLQYLY